MWRLWQVPFSLERQMVMVTKRDPSDIPENVIRLVLLAFGSARLDNEEYFQKLRKRSLPATTWWELYESLYTPSPKRIRDGHAYGSLDEGGRLVEIEKLPFFSRSDVLEVEVSLAEAGKLRLYAPLDGKRPRPMAQRRRYVWNMRNALIHLCADKTRDGARASVAELISMYMSGSASRIMRAAIQPRILRELANARFDRMLSAYLYLLRWRDAMSSLEPRVEYVGGDRTRPRAYYTMDNVLERELLDLLDWKAKTQEDFIRLHGVLGRQDEQRQGGGERYLYSIYPVRGL